MTKITYDIDCSICGRPTPRQHLENHHLIPGDRKGGTITVCTSCGDQLHQLFTRNELKRQYNTFAKLLANEKVQKWIEWIRSKKDFVVCMKRKK